MKTKATVQLQGLHTMQQGKAITLVALVITIIVLLINEFVWVPVKDMPYTCDRYAFVGGNMNYLEDGVDKATNSVKITYGSSYYTEAIPVEEQKIQVG